MLYTELGNITQRNSKSSFRDKILELSSLLKDIQITRRGESKKEATIQSNDEYALTILKKELTEEFRTVISAARPTALLHAT